MTSFVEEKSTVKENEMRVPGKLQNQIQDELKKIG